MTLPHTEQSSEQSATARHTPSPWRIAEGFGEFEVEGSDGAFLAAVATEVDAHLIASAPELYEALKALIRGVDVGLVVALNETFKADALALIDTARKALLKAEGQ
jgi:hypothetical protein